MHIKKILKKLKITGALSYKDLHFYMIGQSKWSEFLLFTLKIDIEASLASGSRGMSTPCLPKQGQTAVSQASKYLMPVILMNIWGLEEQLDRQISLYSHAQTSKHIISVSLTLNLTRRLK